jgi:hypothetical protein
MLRNWQDIQEGMPPAWELVVKNRYVGSRSEYQCAVRADTVQMSAFGEFPHVVSNDNGEIL